MRESVWVSANLVKHKTFSFISFVIKKERKHEKDFKYHYINDYRNPNFKYLHTMIYWKKKLNNPPQKHVTTLH